MDKTILLLAVDHRLEEKEEGKSSDWFYITAETRCLGMLATCVVSLTPSTVNTRFDVGFLVVERSQKK